MSDPFPFPDSLAFPFPVLVPQGGFEEQSENLFFDQFNSQLFYSRVPDIQDPNSTKFVLQISGFIRINPTFKSNKFLVAMQLSINVDDKFITKPIEYRDLSNLLNATVDNQYSFILRGADNTLLANISLGKIYKSSISVNYSDGSSHLFPLLEVTLKSAPEPVTNLVYDPYDDGSVLMRWIDGNDNSDPISHYEFTLFNTVNKTISLHSIGKDDLIKSDDDVPGLVRETNTNYKYYIISDISNDVKYNINLSTSNGYGSSYPTTIADVLTSDVPFKPTIKSIVKHDTNNKFIVDCLNNSFSPDGFEIRGAILTEKTDKHDGLEMDAKDLFDNLTGSQKTLFQTMKDEIQTGATTLSELKRTMIVSQPELIVNINASAAALEAKLAADATIKLYYFEIDEDNKFIQSDVRPEDESRFIHMVSNEPFTLEFTPPHPNINHAYKYEVLLINQKNNGKNSDPYFGYILNSTAISGSLSNEPFLNMDGVRVNQPLTLINQVLDHTGLTNKKLLYYGENLTSSFPDSITYNEFLYKFTDTNNIKYHIHKDSIDNTLYEIVYYWTFTNFKTSRNDFVELIGDTTIPAITYPEKSLLQQRVRDLLTDISNNSVYPSIYDLMDPSYSLPQTSSPSNYPMPLGIKLIAEGTFINSVNYKDVAGAEEVAGAKEATLASLIEGERVQAGLRKVAAEAAAEAAYQAACDAAGAAHEPGMDNGDPDAKDAYDTAIDLAVQARDAAIDDALRAYNDEIDAIIDAISGLPEIVEARAAALQARGNAIALKTSFNDNTKDYMLIPEAKKSITTPIDISYVNIDSSYKPTLGVSIKLVKDDIDITVNPVLFPNGYVYESGSIQLNIIDDYDVDVDVPYTGVIPVISGFPDLMKLRKSDFVGLTLVPGYYYSVKIEYEFSNPNLPDSVNLKVREESDPILYLAPPIPPGLSNITRAANDNTKKTDITFTLDQNEQAIEFDYTEVYVFNKEVTVLQSGDLSEDLLTATNKAEYTTDGEKVLNSNINNGNNMWIVARSLVANSEFQFYSAWSIVDEIIYINGTPPPVDSVTVTLNNNGNIDIAIATTTIATNPNGNINSYSEFRVILYAKIGDTFLYEFNTTNSSTSINYGNIYSLMTDGTDYYIAVDGYVETTPQAVITKSTPFTYYLPTTITLPPELNFGTIGMNVGNSISQNNVDGSISGFWSHDGNDLTAIKAISGVTDAYYQVSAGIAGGQFGLATTTALNYTFARGTGTDGFAPSAGDSVNVKVELIVEYMRVKTIVDDTSDDFTYGQNVTPPPPVTQLNVLVDAMTGDIDLLWIAPSLLETEWATYNKYNLEIMDLLNTTKLSNTNTSNTTTTRFTAVAGLVENNQYSVKITAFTVFADLDQTTDCPSEPAYFTFTYTKTGKPIDLSFPVLISPVSDVLSTQNLETGDIKVEWSQTTANYLEFLKNKGATDAFYEATISHGQQSFTITKITDLYCNFVDGSGNFTGFALNDVIDVSVRVVVIYLGSTFTSAAATDDFIYGTLNPPKISELTVSVNNNTGTITPSWTDPTFTGIWQDISKFVLEILDSYGIPVIANGNPVKKEITLAQSKAYTLNGLLTSGTQYKLSVKTVFTENGQSWTSQALIEPFTYYKNSSIPASTVNTVVQDIDGTGNITVYATAPNVTTISGYGNWAKNANGSFNLGFDLEVYDVTRAQLVDTSTSNKTISYNSLNNTVEITLLYSEMKNLLTVGDTYALVVSVTTYDITDNTKYTSKSISSSGSTLDFARQNGTPPSVTGITLTENKDGDLLVAWTDPKNNTDWPNGNWATVDGYDIIIEETNDGTTHYSFFTITDGTATSFTILKSSYGNFTNDRKYKVNVKYQVTDTFTNNQKNSSDSFSAFITYKTEVVLNEITKLLSGGYYKLNINTFTPLNSMIVRAVAIIVLEDGTVDHYTYTSGGTDYFTQAINHLNLGNENAHVLGISQTSDIKSAIVSITDTTGRITYKTLGM